MFGHLPADERATGLTATVGDTLDELLDVVGVELADGDVVEEEERPVAWAMRALVPTPSVEDTRTGWL
jgi:hypothetical protein